MTILTLTLLAISPISWGSSAYQGTTDYLVEYLQSNLTQNSRAQYEFTYAAGGSQSNKCITCHGTTGGGAITNVNPFGVDFKNETISQTGISSNASQTRFNQILSAIMSKDSDGDGSSNQDEFINLTNPNVVDATSTNPTPTPTPTPNTGGGSTDSGNSSSETFPATGDERILKGSGGCGAGLTTKEAGYGGFIVFLLPLLLLTRRLRLWAIMLAFGLPWNSADAASLRVLRGPVKVFSGPSKSFRIIQSLQQGATAAASESIVRNKNQEFYKIQIPSRGGRQRLGFVEVSDATTLDFGGSVAQQTQSRQQFNNAVQSKLMNFSNQNYFWSVSYNKYWKQSLFYKMFVGQWLHLLSSSGILGGGVGYERTLTPTVTGYAAADLGYMFGSGNNAIYPGMEQGTNFLIGLSGGAKYSTNEFAAIGAELSYANLAGGNGSFSSVGWTLLMEIGLP